VAVDYATADGSAQAPDDYAPTAGMLVFGPGETSKTITVKVKGDTLPEPDETFVVRLSNPFGAAIGDGEGMATIVDDGDALGQPDFQLLVSPPGIQALTPGGSITFTVGAVSLFGFDQPVKLSVRGLPAGVTPTFSVNQL